MTPRHTIRLALTVFILAAPALVAHDNPPEVHQAGDHWTAWDPPESQPEGTEIYVVQPGDTLWDLAGRFYGDSYLWPQLWERNQYVKDSHWIYPGDPLVVNVEATSLDEIAGITEDSEAGRDGDSEGGGGGLSLDRSTSPPEALGGEDDIYCTGYIGDLEESFPFAIMGSEHENLSPRQGSGGNVPVRYGIPPTTKVGLTTSDIVYVDGGREAGLVAGEIFTAVQPEQVIRHPLDNRVVGRFYRYLGRIQILSVQQTTGIAEIVHGCEPIVVGSVLKRFTPEPVPLARRGGMRGVNDPAGREQVYQGGSILFQDRDLVSLGEGHVVFIDRGDRDEVTPGDIYTIYRETRPGQPLLVLGELGILSVQEGSSLAKILESRYTVRVGDLIDPKFR